MLYTSGSTGAPEPHPKTLLQLVAGALALGERLAQDVAGGLSAMRRLVCSVPPQHMFGFEASVMFPLVHGIPVNEGRPLLPADVRQAFVGSPTSAWITTPLHMRGLVRSGEALPNCTLVLASTMPLTQQLARQTESLVGAPVLEIYGSTETGVLAMRCSAHETSWRPVRGVRVAATHDATLSWGVHFSSPVRLPDETEIDATGCFRLLGRSTDMVKIGGRRASLAGLNLLLEGLPGLEDGVLYLPNTTNPTERLCLIYSGPALDRAAVEEWLRGRLDPAFMPRTFVHVDKLAPKRRREIAASGFGCAVCGMATPNQAVKCIGRGMIAPSRTFGFEFAVEPAHPALAGHFPGHPIVPGVLLLDRVMSAVTAELKRPVSVLKQVKFAAALLPGESAMVTCDECGDRLSFTVKARRADALVTLASGQAILAHWPTSLGAAPGPGVA